MCRLRNHIILVSRVSSNKRYILIIRVFVLHLITIHHIIQQQNRNNTKTYCKLFHQTIHKHATHKTNRYTNRTTHKIQGYNITLTPTQVQLAIKQSKNNNSQCPDKLNIRHLKHIGPLGLAFLKSMLKTALNTNIISHIWKLANIVISPHPKTQQRHRQGRLIHAHIPPLSNCRHWRRAFFLT